MGGRGEGGDARARPRHLDLSGEDYQDDITDVALCARGGRRARRVAAPGAAPTVRDRAGRSARASAPGRARRRRSAGPRLRGGKRPPRTRRRPSPPRALRPRGHRRPSADRHRQPAARAGGLPDALADEQEGVAGRELGRADLRLDRLHQPEGLGKDPPEWAVGVLGTGHAAETERHRRDRGFLGELLGPRSPDPAGAGVPHVGHARGVACGRDRCERGAHPSLLAARRVADGGTRRPRDVCEGVRGDQLRLRGRAARQRRAGGREARGGLGEGRDREPGRVITGVAATHSVRHGEGAVRDVHQGGVLVVGRRPLASGPSRGPAAAPDLWRRHRVRSLDPGSTRLCKPVAHYCLDG